jgi:hypothetical protein
MGMASSISELTSALIVECSNNPILRDIPEAKVQEIIDTLVRYQFSEDNRKNAKTNLEKSLFEIVNLLSEGD